MIHPLALILPDPEHSRPARVVLALGYLVAALCWLAAGLRARNAREQTLRRWWLLGALLLLLLAANKLFDFRAQCELLIRMLAKSSGWYDRRQPVQFFLAIVLPSVAGFVVLMVMLRTTARRFVRQHPFALPGWFLVLLYLALRQTQEWKPALVWLGSVNYYQWRLPLEVAGIGLVTLAAILAWKAKN